MNSFLITFKPSTESPERGWPLDDLQRLAKRHNQGHVVDEDWRFRNQKEVSVGDRVFLLLQGKRGPAIIGYGRVSRKPRDKSERGRVWVRFDALVNPAAEVLARKNELLKIAEARHLWRTQASGIRLPDRVATLSNC
jgi:hypothetical protein